ncbi:hypothetical protein [Deinococcus roseus]|uniref:Uncharacterized protein n=1 Tax=Deinococcus roseus TaxID=392414 RepID=A0ABQ2D688_9DEIO|nr:hypothetical protein [Deinococcus roseus]GGJ45423.1 hypothetical protein GCM10008938_34710 [Deinococcus roseus]
MNLRRLSEQVALLKNPQRSDQFVRQFRNAVRDGIFDATEIPERFELPKQYAKRGQEGAFSKSAKEMVFELNPAFEAWFNDLDDQLTQNKRTRKVKPSLEAFSKGELDFKTLAAATRAKMKASEEKGKKLGATRKGRKK